MMVMRFFIFPPHVSSKAKPLALRPGLRRESGRSRRKPRRLSSRSGRLPRVSHFAPKGHGTVGGSPSGRPLSPRESCRQPGKYGSGSIRVDATRARFLVPRLARRRRQRLIRSGASASRSRRLALGWFYRPRTVSPPFAARLGAHLDMAASARRLR